MKIISGIFKGKILKSLKKTKCRPTSGLVRKSVFNICRNEIEDAVVLDLFCGFGSVGIEALSMGAKHVFFVEKDKKIFQVLKKNIKDLHLEDRVSLFNLDVFLFLKKYFKKMFSKKSFDIIYMDPPYEMYEDEEFLKNVVFLIKKNKILSKNGIFFVEGPSEKKVYIDDKNFNCIKIKRYGDSFLAFYRGSKNNSL